MLGRFREENIPKIKDIVEIEKKNKEFAEKDLEKAKLPNVIRLLAKEVGYNEAIDVYGNKSIGLDEGKIEKVIDSNNEFPNLSIATLNRGQCEDCDAYEPDEEIKEEKE